jgi:hypothetical protein
MAVFAADDRLFYKSVPEETMGGLRVVDLLVILAVVALLVWAGSHDFARYDGRTVETHPTASP